MNIIYEPYIFSLILSILISIVYYFYKKNNLNNLDEEELSETDTNLLAPTVVVLLLSYIIIMIIYYSYKYISFEFKSTLPVMVGGGSILSKSTDVEKEINREELESRREKMMERLTIVDDDIDVSILED